MSKVSVPNAIVTDERDWLESEDCDPSLDPEPGRVDREAMRQHAVLRRLKEETSSRRAIYQQLVMCAYQHINHAPARLLCVMANMARADLTNYFMLRRTLMARVGMRSLPTLVSHLRELEADGWIVRHRHAKLNGQRSSAGVQFRLPACVLGIAWEGPVDFSHRSRVRNAVGQAVGIVDQFLDDPSAFDVVAKHE